MIQDGAILEVQVVVLIIRGAEAGVLIIRGAEVLAAAGAIVPGAGGVIQLFDKRKFSMLV